MSNWVGMLEGIRDTRSLPSFFPADLTIPMVSPGDLGEAAARRLVEPVSDVDLRYVEGPERYTPRDVADALGEALGAKIDLNVIPLEAWEATFVQFGFSPAAAKTYACMTGAVVNGEPATPADPERGRTTLREYIGEVVGRRG
jgi:uncharacterized protein YbjT (DUF2867 family)